MVFPLLDRIRDARRHFLGHDALVNLAATITAWDCDIRVLHPVCVVVRGIDRVVYSAVGTYRFREWQLQLVCYGGSAEWSDDEHVGLVGTEVYLSELDCGVGVPVDWGDFLVLDDDYELPGLSDG